jgi:hypothetical protein
MWGGVNMLPLLTGEDAIGRGPSLGVGWPMPVMVGALIQHEVDTLRCGQEAAPHGDFDGTDENMSFEQLSADSGEEVLQKPFDEEKVGEGAGSEIEIHGVVSTMYV